MSSKHSARPTCAGAEFPGSAGRRDPRVDAGGARGGGRRAGTLAPPRHGARLRGRPRGRKDDPHPSHRARARRHCAGHQPDLRAGAPLSGAPRSGLPPRLLPVALAGGSRRPGLGGAGGRRRCHPGRVAPPGGRVAPAAHSMVSAASPGRSGAAWPGGALMWLAIETATERASVAVGRSAAEAVEEGLAGARRHAAGLLPMIAAALDRAGVTLDDLTGLALSDGPGSFTGLRVGASVAKALVHARGLPLWTAPSLMVRASGVAREGDTVLAVADALRGEVYAAAYRFEPEEVVTLLAPSVYRPETLIAAAPRPSILVGEAPTAAVEALERWSGCRLVGLPDGGPRARHLIGLVGRQGGAVR